MKKNTSAVRVEVDVSARHEHTLRVRLTAEPTGEFTVLSLPVWIPGSYMVREFGRHLSGLVAHQGEHDCEVVALDKTTWQVATPSRATLVVEYDVYAFDTSVRTAYLGADRAFFNLTSVALRVEGRHREAHELVLYGVPEGWEVATAMAPLTGPKGGVFKRTATGGHRYQAADYDEFVDHPFELGAFWRGRFEVQGAEHEFVVAGAWPGFDGDRLLADTKRICEEHIRFWHGRKGRPPFQRYVFMLNAMDDAYGGLEHRASTALVAARKDLPRVGEPGSPDGYITLLGLISHEYFHTWNVKRLKPRELCDIDYSRENYTELLWFFEGFTSYFDDLALLRAGLIDAERYVKLLAKTATAVQAMPGRQVQTVAQASFDAWNKYYRQDENTPNATVSYYTKGAQVALGLDLTLRQSGKGSLDAVMRRLWALGGDAPDPGSIGIGEDDIAEALKAVGGRSYAKELRQWVHGMDELPVDKWLAAAGIKAQAEAPKLSVRWGLRLNEGPVTGCVVRGVLRGSAAEQAGLCAGDEIWAVNGWRLRRLDDAAQWLAPGEDAQLLVARDQRVLTLQVAGGAKAQGTQALAQHWTLDSAPADSKVAALRRAWWARSA